MPSAAVPWTRPSGSSPASLTCSHMSEEEQMQLRVDTDGLRESAAALEEVLARLDRTRVVEELAPVGWAFRGGETEAVSGLACRGWNARLSALRSTVRATGMALQASASAYDA